MSLGSPRGLPVSHAEARKAAGFVMDYPGADGVEVVISASADALTRYANSQIIQNTVRKEARAAVRVVVGDRAASATTTQLDEQHLLLAAGRALEAAGASPPDADFPGLPTPDEVGRCEPVMRWDDATAAVTPAARAAAVNQLITAAGDSSAAGIYQTGAHAYGVFSSSGIECFDAYTRCNTTCLVDIGEATGWAEGSAHAVSEVDAEGTARRARAKADAGRGASDAEPGVYEVVLEPSAVAILIDYLGYMGFGAKQMLEGESFLSFRQGEAVAHPSITVADDVFHPDSIGIAFDFEGVPKRRVAVIDRGEAVGPVTDLRTAMKMGSTSSGHYSGSNEFGPYPFNLVMEAGDRSLDELIGDVDEGLLITRFHYVNILDRPATDLTGMTRDGTFRISKGEVAGPVHNFRFAQNALGALKSVQGVGRDLAAIAPDYSSFGSTVAPALRLGEFNFASRTSH